MRFQFLVLGSEHWKISLLKSMHKSKKLQSKLQLQRMVVVCAIHNNNSFLFFHSFSLAIYAFLNLSFAYHFPPSVFYSIRHHSNINSSVINYYLSITIFLILFVCVYLWFGVSTIISSHEHVIYVLTSSFYLIYDYWLASVCVTFSWMVSIDFVVWKIFPFIHSLILFSALFQKKEKKLYHSFAHITIRICRSIIYSD